MNEGRRRNLEEIARLAQARAAADGVPQNRIDEFMRGFREAAGMGPEPAAPSGVDSECGKLRAT